MRILCLHGWGTNSDVPHFRTPKQLALSAETTWEAALRYLVGDHEYHYVDGAIVWPTAPGIEEVFGSEDEYYTYFLPESALGILSAVNYLAEHVASKGPFDAVMGFSQGASLAATLILREQEASKGRDSAANVGRQQPFKCAIFLSGQLPFDCGGLEKGEIRQLEPEYDQVVIEIPTTNFWGLNDELYPDASPKLSRLCASDRNIDVTHMSGHGIPSKGDKLEEMAAAFRATLQQVEKLVV